MFLSRFFFFIYTKDRFFPNTELRKQKSFPTSQHFLLLIRISGWIISLSLLFWTTLLLGETEKTDYPLGLARHSNPSITQHPEVLRPCVRITSGMHVVPLLSELGGLNTPFLLEYFGSKMLGFRHGLLTFLAEFSAGTIVRQCQHVLLRFSCIHCCLAFMALFENLFHFKSIQTFSLFKINLIILKARHGTLSCFQTTLVTHQA